MPALNRHLLRKMLLITGLVLAYGMRFAPEQHHYSNIHKTERIFRNFGFWKFSQITDINNKITVREHVFLAHSQPASTKCLIIYSILIRRREQTNICAVTHLFPSVVEEFCHLIWKRVCVCLHWRLAVINQRCMKKYIHVSCVHNRSFCGSSIVNVHAGAI